VEGVTLDPLPAIEQPAKGDGRRIDFDPEGCLGRVDRCHLVRDWADAADAGDDVDDLVHGSADDQPLEIARRLEDLEPGRLHGAFPHAEVKRALTLDAGQVAHVDIEVCAARGDHGVMHRLAP
jgi:hypothetical protein